MLPVLKSKLMANGKGFSLLEVVLAMAILMISVVVTAPMVINVFSNIQSFERRAQIFSLEIELARFMKHDQVCPCNLQTLTVDETQVIPADVDVPGLRLTCNPSDPYFVEPGKKVPGKSDIEVESLKLVEIKKLDTAKYSAVLETKFTPKPGSKDLPALTIPLIFQISASTGSPGARPIKDCGKPPSNRIVDCPSDMTMVGNSGSVGTFCIDSSLRSVPTNVAQAQSICIALNTTQPPDVGYFQMCPQYILTLACHSGQVPSMDGTNWEMSQQSGPDVAGLSREFVNGAGCGTIGRAIGYREYRCCLL